MLESVTAMHLGFPGTPTLARALGAGQSMSFPSPLAAVCSIYRSSSNTSSVSTRLPIVCASSEVKSSVVHPLGIMTAADVVKDFYGGINCRDFLVVESLIAEDCVYEDLVFPQPFVGRKAILEFFKKFTKTTSADLQFVIDDISKEDSLAVGVTWHLEWRGKSFPFSKGCSFYRFEVREGKRQIVYGRDCVEPAVKPGDLALAPKSLNRLLSVSKKDKVVAAILDVAISGNRGSTPRYYSKRHDSNNAVILPLLSDERERKVATLAKGKRKVGAHQRPLTLDAGVNSDGSEESMLQQVGLLG